MALQTVYCTKEFLEQAIAQRKTSEVFKTAYNIIAKISNIVVDIPKSNLDQLIRTDDLFKVLNNRPGMSIVSNVNWKNEIIDPDENAHTIVFSNSNLHETSKKDRQKEGRYVVVHDNSNDVAFVLNHAQRYECFILPSEKQNSIELMQTWEEALSGGVVPVNAMVINDNYQFSSHDIFERCKNYSLYSILKTLIPSDLDSEFHLSILTHEGSKDWLSTIVEEIRSLNLCKKIKVQIIRHENTDLTHDRYIFTNYHMIYSGKGFNTIGSDKRPDERVGDLKSIFLGINTQKPPFFTKAIYNQKLIDFHNVIEKESQFIVGDEFTNRLFR